MSFRSFAIAFSLSLLAPCLALETAHAEEPIYLEIVPEQDHSSSDPLAPFDVLFILHSNGNPIQGMDIPEQILFSNGNILGVLAEQPNGNSQVIWSPTSISTFASRGFNTHFGQNPTSPDTMAMGLVSFGPAWKGTGEIFRIRVTPTDTGTIKFNPFPCCFLEFNEPTYFDPLGGTYSSSELLNPTILVPPQPGDVRLRATTHTGTDTIFFGPPATIYFRMDAAGNEIAGAAMVFRWSFTNGNIIGPIPQESNQVVFSDAVLDAFESVSWNGFNGGPTDTSLVGLVDFDGDGYAADEVAWSVTFTPSDTGTILIHSGTDFTVPPMCCGSSANDSDAQDLPISWIPVRIPVVPCPYNLMGDVNQDDVLTSSDLITFINYLFKSGPPPLPDRSIGDANCSGGLTGADVIVLVNYIFKGGTPPCACIVRRI